MAGSREGVLTRDSIMMYTRRNKALKIHQSFYISPCSSNTWLDFSTALRRHARCLGPCRMRSGRMPLRYCSAPGSRTFGRGQGTGFSPKTRTHLADRNTGYPELNRHKPARPKERGKLNEGLGSTEKYALEVSTSSID